MEGDWEKGEARTPVRISINFILITIEACRGYCLNIDLLYSGLVNRSWEIHHKLPNFPGRSVMVAPVIWDDGEWFESNVLDHEFRQS